MHTSIVRFLLFSGFLVIALTTGAQDIYIKHNHAQKQIEFGNKNISLTLDYNRKANLSSLMLNGKPVVQGDSGIYSSIRIQQRGYSTLHLQAVPLATTAGNTVVLSNIIYGGSSQPFHETWRFIISSRDIQFTIERILTKPIIAEQVSLPVFTFADTSIWEGAYTDYGGLAWFYLFNKRLDTYGVHSHSSQFWNSHSNAGLDVSVSAPDNDIVTDYSRTATDHLAFTVGIAPSPFALRFDSGTQRRRFVRDTTDVWAPVALNKGTTKATITLTPFAFSERFGRGTMKGVDGEEVSAVLNTIARIGVIDKQHFGGNSWHTPYGPICLHEQYIAQMGLAINDMNYLKGYQQCLDFYRDNAITKEGRVWPRWAYSNEDAMPEKFTGKGFYEAQWGYLLDSNPDFVTNVSDLYNQTGDKAWVKTQQAACEKALDWILKRDSNRNGLVEMMTDSIAQKRSSDWIDIIWASYENAFVNAKLYHALILWADIEKQLGNAAKQNTYLDAANKLKTSFNKPTTQGGFWEAQKQCYVHWLDKDGSVHGNNTVTPVNFMAIAYGICDDEGRKKTILDNIEAQMQKENLFFWPLCLYSYAPGESNDWQFPFPAYENGDLFLSWGSVAVQAYASYKPELAVKYVNNVLAQYAKDGLAFQRYGRARQDGLGDDILAGNGLSVVGLYQSIYGINPMYNRLSLTPHITPELSGTQLTYNYQGQKLAIHLDTGRYTVSNGRYTISGTQPFGFSARGNTFRYFSGEANYPTVTISGADNLRYEAHSTSETKVSWAQSAGVASGVPLTYTVGGLLPGRTFLVTVNGSTIQKLKSGSAGIVTFRYQLPAGRKEISVDWAE